MTPAKRLEVVIARLPPSDGQDWECQCARCGSSMAYPCAAEGLTWMCLSSPEWCEANPLKGREQVRRGSIEWFVVRGREVSP